MSELFLILVTFVASTTAAVVGLGGGILLISVMPGLRAVAALPGIARRVLVYGGKRSFRTGDEIDVWSIRRLQQALAESALWP